MVTETPIRVVVVDDSTIYRKVVRDVLGGMSNVEVIGTATDGIQALEKIAQLSPDLVTLDLEMPRLGGLGVLHRLQESGQRTAAIMLSARTSRGAAATTQALRLGAFDFVMKPSGDSVTQSLRLLREALTPKIDAFSQAIKRTAAKPAPPTAAQACRDLPPAQGPVEVIGVGVSTGGPAALANVLPRLPADFPVPIAIVQHMPPMFTKSLADDLNKSCSLNVSEAVDGQTLSQGDIVIAPGGRQMKVVRTAMGCVVRITDDSPEQACRPSVDYLFRSLAEACGSAAVGVVLTGMGEDGAIGCRLLKQKGARIIAQDEETCVVFGMPRQPIQEGLSDAISPLEGIAVQMLRSVGNGVAACS